MSSDEPKDKTFVYEGREEKTDAEKGTVSEDLYVLSDSGDPDKWVEEEIAWAERAIAELNEAENRGKALSTIDGKLIDNPHRALAERILSRRKPH